MKTTLAVKLIFAVIGCIVSNAGPLYADIRAEPVFTEIVVSPGSATGGVWAVTNAGDEPVRITAEYGEDWLTVTPKEFDIAPGGARAVEYAIRPPRGREGELSATVFFASGTGRKFGVAIFAGIKNTIVLGCNIDNIKIRSREEEGDILFIMDVENTGNAHLRPEGKILITHEGGSEYEIKIEKAFPVYPGASLNYAVRWGERNVPPGKYEAVVKLDYGSAYGEEETVEARVEFMLEE